MSDNTRIQWADSSWNPIVGCTPISAGCEHCYAKKMAPRLEGRFGYPNDFSIPTLRPGALCEPLRWKKPRRIFLCSMGDFFHGALHISDRMAVLNIIKRCPQHTFMVLTKRPQYMAAWSTEYLFPPNVWAGTTVESQDTIGRIKDLKRVQASVRYLSLEPLLGPIDFAGRLDSGIHWVIAGPETGPGRRECPTDNLRSVRDQTKEAGLPFFLKGMFVDGEWTRELDGREWNEFPEVSHG